MPAEVYQLSQRSYRLIDHLFPTGAAARGQVTFEEFGRSMASLGFAQIALGCSSYRFFKPADEAHDDQNIVVHRRHLDPAYRPSDLRRIGRWLSSRFRLKAHTFKVA
jgi:hypothetical protein